MNESVAARFSKHRTIEKKKKIIQKNWNHGPKTTSRGKQARLTDHKCTLSKIARFHQYILITYNIFHCPDLAFRFFTKIYTSHLPCATGTKNEKEEIVTEHFFQQLTISSNSSVTAQQNHSSGRSNAVLHSTGQKNSEHNLHTRGRNRFNNRYTITWQT